MTDGLQVLLDDGTGTFPYNITSKVRLRDGGFTSSLGRQDEQSDVTPGQATLVLNNTDGRFTLGSTIIASPSPIRVDQRIRINEIANGITFNRHTGYVQSWPVSWPGGKSLSLASISSTDAQARAERRPLRSVVEEEVLADSPSAYYTLGDPEGSTTAADSSGNQQPALTMFGSGTAVTFGSATGPATDSLTAASFANGQYLRGTFPQPSVTAIPGLVVAFNASAAPAVNATLLRFGNARLPNQYFELVMTTSGAIVGKSAHDGVSGASAANYADGATHVAELVFPLGNLVVYVDGVAVVSPGGGISSIPLSKMTVGEYFTGTLAHAAAIPASASTTRAIAHSAAMLTGFAGESCVARMTRVAGYAGIHVTLDGDVPQTTVPFNDFTGSSAADAMRDVADAEMGLAFINGTGLLPFHSRSRGPSKTAPDITITASLLSEDTTFTVDMQGVVNYFEVTARGTGITQVVRNATSENGDGTATNPGHGRYPFSKDYLVTTDQEAVDRANWIITKHAEPAPRVSALNIDLLTLTAAQQAALLAAEPDTWIRVTGLPSQTPGGTTADLAVQGISEARTDTVWTLTLNVVSRSLVNALILDNATYGALDQYPILF